MILEKNVWANMLYLCVLVSFLSIWSIFLNEKRAHLFEMRLIRINTVYQKFMAFSCAGAEVIKLFSSSPQMTIKFILLINETRGTMVL